MYTIATYRAGEAVVKYMVKSKAVGGLYSIFVGIEACTLNTGFGIIGTSAAVF